MQLQWRHVQLLLLLLQQHQLMVAACMTSAVILLRVAFLSGGHAVSLVHASIINMTAGTARPTGSISEFVPQHYGTVAAQ